MPMTLKKNLPVEGKTSLRFDIPISLKTEFENACWEHKKTMSDMVRSLIKDFVKIKK